MSSHSKSDTEHLPTQDEFCGTVATTALLYDHSYITRFAFPDINSRNTQITPQRYSRLQQNITHTIQSNTNQNHIESNPNLTQLKRDVQTAFNDTSAGYQYPNSNPIHQINVDTKHKKMAKFNKNTINKNNPNTLSLHHVEEILTLSRPKVMADTNTEEKSMDIDSTNTSSVDTKLRRMSLQLNGIETNHNKPLNHHKIRPLKRKLTEIIITPKLQSNKRRKLTHRRASMTRSQSPFLQRSMSLSSSDLNHNTQCTVTDNIKNVESHLNAFCGRYRECVEDIPLGHIDMERATGAEQMSWMTVRFNIESLAKCHQIQSIQKQIMSNLLYLIDKQLCSAMDCKLINPPHIPFQADVDNVAKGIEAAIIALYIMTAKNIHRSLVQDDVLWKILRLITFQITNNFAPCKDEEQRDEYKEFFNKQMEKKSKKKRKKTKHKPKESEEEVFWKNLNVQMNVLYADFCSALLLLINIYTEREIVREQQITELLNCCFSTFDIQNIDDIQDGCKSLVITIFVKYEEHRDDIIDRILNYYRNTERIYFAKRKIAESKDKYTNYIHLINMLILEICQCLSNKMLLNNECELRQIQLMNTTPKRSRFNGHGHKNTKEMTQNTKYELFRKCIMKPMIDCKHILNNIIKGIVKIVIDTKNKGDKLVMFYKDLENVWDLTLWPIAEYALTVTLGAFHSFLNSKHMDNKQFKGVRGYFIAGLSSICATARLAKKIGNRNMIRCTSKSELKTPHGVRSDIASNPLNSGERIDCKCGQNKKNEEMKTMFMIDCDDCHSWSHGDCVGIESAELIPQQWICDFCAINREIEQQLVQINAKHADNGFDEVYDESTKLHILLINYLSKQLPLGLCTESWYIPLLSSHSLSAREFHLIQWLFWRMDTERKSSIAGSDPNKTDVSDSILRLFCSYFLIPLQSQFSCLPTFSDRGIHRVNMSLALNRRLIALHETMIYLIASDLQNTLSKWRTKALKSLKEICDVDAHILSQENIADRVIEKFRDKSASVREAAVDLVGNYIIDNAPLISVYFEDLKVRIMDNAVSVRKRVIRIFRDICLRAPSNPQYRDICLCLFSKMSEKNEGIKKLVASTFEEMWFSDSNLLENRVITKSNRGGNKRFSSSFCKLVQQIIHSISSNDDETAQYLIHLIVKMLEKEEKKTVRAQTKSDLEKNRVFDICCDMVQVIMDKLTKYDKESSVNWIEIKPLIESLYIFCVVRPLFVSPHFVSLQSYIQSPPKYSKTADKSVYKIAIHVLMKLSQILTTIVPFIDKSSITKTSYHQIQKQMIHILWNSELTIELIYDGVYLSLIESLCCVINHLSKDYNFMISRVFDLCIGALSAKRQGIIWSKTNHKVSKSIVIRSLLFLGIGAKYFDVNKHYNDDQMMLKIYNIYLFFLQNDDECEFHQYAIQGFIPLFCREPSLMTKEETTGIMRNILCLASDSNSFVQTECLNALHELFETEERRTQFIQNETEERTQKQIKTHDLNNNNKNKNTIESDDELSEDEELKQLKQNTGINGNVAGIRGRDHNMADTGDLIHFIATLSPLITSLCSSPSSCVRNHCSQILLDWTTSLWSNPLEYLNEIISLCVDPDAKNDKTRNNAFISLNKIIERTPSLFNMKLIAGIIQCFKLSHFSLNIMFIDYPHGSRESASRAMIESILPHNVEKLFSVLDSMTPSKQQQIIASITRCMINYMDFTLCIKKKIMNKKHNYITIAMFITFLCHFVCCIPFAKYKESEVYCVIHHLDNVIKSNMTHCDKENKIAECMEQCRIHMDAEEDTVNEGVILKNLRNLYRYLCHALICLILYQFRSFWCQLYNLSEDNISLYKLTANKKSKNKNFKAKKSESDEDMLFVLELKQMNKHEMMTQMHHLYQRLFIENIVKHLDSNADDSKTKIHNTRSKLQNESLTYYIPKVFTQIEAQFTKMKIEYNDEYAQDSQEGYTQSDIDIDEHGDEHGDDDDYDIEMKHNKSTQKKKKTKRGRKKQKKKKKKKELYSEDDDDEDVIIVYNDTSSDSSDDDDIDF